MFKGLDTELAIILLTFIPPFVGFILVLIGWGRAIYEWGRTGQRTFPKALWVLTAAVFMGPLWIFVPWVVGILVGLLAMPSGFRYAFLSHLWIVVWGGGFVLSVTALMIAIYEQSAARIAVLVGSAAMAATYVIGFAWLLSTSRGASVL